MNVGVDLVRISRVADSLEQFGDRFLRRVFTRGEIDYAMASPGQAAERLAARFAAKEAARKALRVEDASPIGWQQVEVHRLPSGACELVLHGAARAIATARGVNAVSVSISHEGDYAIAVVMTH